MIVTEELKNLVVDEVTKLKSSILPKEKKNLDINDLDPKTGKSCFYGQLTSSCGSPRSIELLMLCAVPYSTFISNFQPPQSQFADNWIRPFSALEYYCAQPGANNEIIIKYLKGEVQKLEI